jgi:hypothetical protein
MLTGRHHKEALWMCIGQPDAHLRPIATDSKRLQRACPACLPDAVSCSKRSGAICPLLLDLRTGAVKRLSHAGKASAFAYTRTRVRGKA